MLSAVLLAFHVLIIEFRMDDVVRLVPVLRQLVLRPVNSGAAAWLTVS